MASVVTAFFDAYSAMDFAAMSAMMHPDFTFSDPPFGQLDSKSDNGVAGSQAMCAPPTWVLIP